MLVQNSYPFHEGGYQGRKYIRGGRRRGLGGIGYNRPQEEFPRHEAWRENNLFKDYGENPNVAQAYYGGYYVGQQGDKALDKIKWKVPSIKVQKLYPYTTYEDMCHLETKIENKRKRIGFSKTNLHSSRSVVPKPQASTYKSWAKKDETPDMAFKHNSKLKVEEKSRLITNPTRCFKCNGMRHIAMNCPTKRTLVFNEVLNG
ncbi:hypothetical protein M9H77_30143 [Catharanthus roseus]|uniref:Uncharacterized protein n=1 Tax=Catharanthus roseus TaxID=4058 RepID=A0ACB9ZXC7_CATRO|nr:hypothetical protein M9H77_30143 [Catharanthus roseus]